MFAQEDGPPELFGVEATLGLYPLVAVGIAAIIFAIMSCACQKFVPKPKCLKMNVSVFVFLMVGSLGVLTLALSTMYYATPPEDAASSCHILHTQLGQTVSPQNEVTYRAFMNLEYRDETTDELIAATGNLVTTDKDRFDLHVPGANVTCYTRSDDPTTVDFDPPVDDSMLELILVAAFGTLFLMALVACCLSLQCGESKGHHKSSYEVESARPDFNKTTRSPFGTTFEESQIFGDVGDLSRDPSSKSVGMRKSESQIGLLVRGGNDPFGASAVDLDVPNLTPPGTVPEEGDGAVPAGASPWGQVGRSSAPIVSGQSAPSLSFAGAASAVTAHVKLAQSKSVVARRSDEAFNY